MGTRALSVMRGCTGVSVIGSIKLPGGENKMSGQALSDESDERVRHDLMGGRVVTSVCDPQQRLHDSYSFTEVKILSHLLWYDS